MLKRLAILGGAALIVAVILVAAYYEQRNAVGEGYEIKCAQPSEPSSAANSLTCVIQPSQNTEQGKPKPPWWNVLLAWPEGITAWLLLLTLGAIFWQPLETCNAARGAKESAAAAMAQVQFMVAKEQARIEIIFPEESDVMTIRPDEMVTVGSFHLNLRNVGGTVASNITGWYDAFASEENKAPKSEDQFALACPATVEGNSWEKITEAVTIDPRFTADRAPETFYVYLRGEITYNDIFKKELNSKPFLVRRQFMRSRIGEAISRDFWGRADEEGDNEKT